MRQLTVKETESGQRLDKYLGKYLKEAPKSFVYKMLRKKNITLNGKKADGSEKLLPMDVIQFFLAEETLEKFCGKIDTGEKGSLDIVYEDEQVLFVNKPAGMLSQKAEKTDVSVIEYLTAYLLDTGALTREDLKTFRPGVCNRLDRNTSGLVAAGKTIQGLQELSQCFRDRTMHKYYLTLVKGKIEKPAHIRGFLWKDEKRNKVMVSRAGRPDGLPIETKYQPLGISEKGDTLLRVELLTGRSHQIRSHLASIGHPVIGDWKYGEKKINETYKNRYGVKFQLLHGWQLEFPEMDGSLAKLSGKTITAGLPPLFQKVLQGEQLWDKADTGNKGDEC